MNKTEKQRLKKAAKKAARKNRRKPVPRGPAPAPGATPGASSRVLPALQDRLDRAVQAHTDGDLDQAQAQYRAILADQPDHPIALHLLGVIAHQKGRAEEALELIGRALALKPDYAMAHNNLGLVLKALNRNRDAHDSYLQAVGLAPAYAEAHYNLGNAELDISGPAQAVARFRQAITLKPDYWQAHNNLGKALQDLGQTPAAIEAYGAAIALKPAFVDGHYNMASALQDQGQWDAALASYKRAIALDPDYAAAHNNMGNIFKQQNRPKEALDSYRKAISSRPEMADAHLNLGVLLQDLGRFDEAEASYRAALACQPALTTAHKYLSLIRSHSRPDEDMRAMEGLYGQDDLGAPQKADLAFALGKAYEDLGEYDRAFKFFADGNALRRREFSYDPQESAALMARLKAPLAEDCATVPAAQTAAAPVPVFILGMPRSGTSLVEQILASHPLVYGAGELATLADCAGARPGATTVDPGQLGAAYLAELRRLSGGAAFVTDKMPDNFKRIGLIKQAMPSARIIHCRRDAMDTCLSIFKTDFTGTHPYAYDLQELGDYYGLYRDLMAHWHRTLPGFIHDIAYETLVEDTENQIRALLAFCGLDWDPACLAFYRTERAVKTASARQVRRPVYKDAVGRWKRYEKHLSGLRESLAPDGHDTAVTAASQSV